jgi:predicted esterase
MSEGPFRGVRSNRRRAAGRVALWALGASLLPAGVVAQVDASPFHEAYQQLRRGAAYSAGVPTGRLELTRSNRDGLVHRYLVLVPEGYDPARRYPVAFYLHGGVSRADPGPGGGWWRNTEQVAGDDHIAVLPLSWRESLWWHASQVENLHGILSDLKATYNVDENRVYAVGVSDGGTGVYFLGFKDTTPWAAFLPFIGYPGVLLNPRTGADGEMHLANLSSKPFFIVNGETDRLYPARLMRQYLEDFDKAGVEYVFTAKASGHDTRWWPDEADNIERFMASNPRDPLPKRIVWATERADRYNRAHWVVIDEVGPISGDEGRGALAALTSNGRSGLVEVVQHGNTVMVNAFHVRRFTLLISPDGFDLEEPIRVVTNGDLSFQGRVEPNVETLTKWAERDEDRTMLFADEITIELAPPERGG